MATIPNRIRAALVLPVLLASLAAPLAGPTAFARSAPPAKPLPVVATMFSNLHPKVGQRETVTAQFFIYRTKKPNQYVPGAKLTVAVELGKKTLMTVKGTTTNKQGKATATFTVPAQAKGKALWAYTKLSYKGKHYQGSSQVQVSTAR